MAAGKRRKRRLANFSAVTNTRGVPLPVSGQGASCKIQYRLKWHIPLPKKGVKAREHFATGRLDRQHMAIETDSQNIFETHPELREFILSRLTDALLDRDPEVRRIAALNLGRVGDEAFRAVPHLYKMLIDDPVPELRQLAASVLAGLGERTIPFLMHALTNSNLDTYNAARQVLDTHPLQKRELVAALVQAINDPDPYYRFQAVKSLFYALDGRIDRDYVYVDQTIGERAFEAFRRALADSDEMVRLVAGYALWIVLRDTSGVEMIETVSQNPDSQNQELAAGMMKAIRMGMEND